MIRNLLKHAYRYPVMVILPQFLGNVGAAFAIAFFEVWVVVPLERLKILRILQGKTTVLKGSFYQGTFVTVLRQIISWLTFLPPQQEMIKWAKNLSGGDLPLTSILIISIVVGLFNNLCVMPIDCIKTRIQKAEDAPKFFSAAKEIYSSSPYKNIKWRIFYTGLFPRFIQYGVQSFFTSLILGRLMR